MSYVTKLALAWVPCNLCGSETFDYIYREHSNVVRCTVCGLTMYNPQPTPEALVDYYNHETGYLPSIRRDVRENYHANPAPLIAVFDGVLFRLANATAATACARPGDGAQMTELAAGPLLLEVGCAYGFLLKRAREWGWRVAGIEVATESSTFAREELGLAVETGTVFDCTIPECSVDCIVMMQVIEHVSDPMSMLKRIRALLRPGGGLYLTTPNVESVAARLQKQGWEFKSFPNHLWYFSAETLQRALMSAGFRIREISSHPGESTVGLDELLIRKQLFLDTEEGVREFMPLVQKHLRCSELYAIAIAG